MDELHVRIIYPHSIVTANSAVAVAFETTLFASFCYQLLLSVNKALLLFCKHSELFQLGLSLICTKLCY